MKAPASPRPAKTKGVTLVELIIAIAVLAILMALAVPSFQFVRNVNRLSASANDLVAGLQLARMEAIRRNARVVFCRSDDGASCSGAAGAWAGWMVASDEDGNGTFGNTDTERLRTGTVAAGMDVRSSAALAGLNNRLTFRSDGFAYTAGQVPVTASIGACLTTTSPAENRRRVSVRTGGRITVVRETDAACGQPPN